jgi:DHA3 family tetracycline resistance protein-like MFS transporter
VQHSHEGLDRIGGISRVNLLEPLRDRDFRTLWTGMVVSLIGDGAFHVAMAWQAYAISNAPMALSLLGISMTVPHIVFLLLGGVVSDRFDRRRVMLIADVVRALAAATLATLSLTGALELWHMAVLVAFYGAGNAFFGPAFDAIVPDVLPKRLLGQANALDQFVRPLAVRMAGPAIGGALIPLVGVGAVFALDAGSFLASAAALMLMRTRRPMRVDGELSVADDVREGYRFVRANVWLWGSFVAAAFAYLVFMGPVEVLLPYVVKNDLGGSARDLGLVFAAGGLGAILAAVWMAQRDQPRRNILAMYAAWTLATVAVTGYGLAVAPWQLMVACFMFNALETIGTIVWATTKQRLVPAHMLGRVSSLDWLISIGLLPLSFALTGPAHALLGAQTTLVWAGVIGGVLTAGALCLPGMRDVERTGVAVVPGGGGSTAPPQPPPLPTGKRFRGEAAVVPLRARAVDEPTAPGVLPPARRAA